MTAAEWRGWAHSKSLNERGLEIFTLIRALEAEEAQVAAYREDRLALAVRIDELEQQINGGEY